MKKYNLLIILFFTLPILFSSCNNETEKQGSDKNEESSQDEIDIQKDEAARVKSRKVQGVTKTKENSNSVQRNFLFNPGDTVVWKAKHNDDADFVHIGSVEIKEGNAEFLGDQLISGEVIIDLTTLQKGNPRLDNHLKDDDFFNVEVYPTATFQLKSYENGTANGELTVLGITQKISFALNVSLDENTLSISGEFEVDLLPFELPSLVKVENSPAKEKASGPSSKINIAIALTAHP